MGTGKNKERLPHFALISILAHTHLNLISLFFTFPLRGALFPFSDWTETVVAHKNLGVYSFTQQAAVGSTWSYRAGGAPRSRGKKPGGAFPPTKPPSLPWDSFCRSNWNQSSSLSFCTPLLLLLLSSTSFSPPFSHLLLSSILLPKPILRGIQLHHMRVKLV